MRSLSAAEKDTAGPCAPSRSVVSYTTIFLADIKKPPDLLGREVPRTSDCALSRGASPANLDPNRALVAHRAGKARAWDGRRAWLSAPIPPGGDSVTATANPAATCVPASALGSPVALRCGGMSPEAVGLLVECRDEPGLLHRITEAILRHGANISYVAGGASRSEAVAELQLEVAGAPDQERLVSDLESVQGVTKVSLVPTFQMIYGKRVIVIGGGAQVGMVAQGAISEADRHNIRGERISVDTIPLVGEEQLADAVRAVARLHRARALVLAGDRQSTRL